MRTYWFWGSRYGLHALPKIENIKRFSLYAAAVSPEQVQMPRKSPQKGKRSKGGVMYGKRLIERLMRLIFCA